MELTWYWADNWLSKAVKFIKFFWVDSLSAVLWISQLFGILFLFWKFRELLPFSQKTVLTCDYFSAVGFSWQHFIMPQSRISPTLRHISTVLLPLCGSPLVARPHGDQRGQHLCLLTELSGVITSEPHLSFSSALTFSKWVPSQICA